MVGLSGFQKEFKKADHLSIEQIWTIWIPDVSGIVKAVHFNA